VGETISRKVELGRHLKQRAGVLRRLVHLPHVSSHHADFESSGQCAAGFHPLAQRLQRHQLELADAIAFPVDYGSQSAPFDLELGARVLVRGLTKSGK
jgi:hypothetical protein